MFDVSNLYTSENIELDEESTIAIFEELDNPHITTRLNLPSPCAGAVAPAIPCAQWAFTTVVGSQPATRPLQLVIHQLLTSASTISVG